MCHVDRCFGASSKTKAEHCFAQGMQTQIHLIESNMLQELSAFLRKRSSLEEEHANALKKLCRSTLDGVLRKEARAGSYGSNFEEVVKVHDAMAEHEISFGLNSHQMSIDLENMAHDMERGRKQWKQTALAAEQRVQDAERQLDKAKLKYESLAEDYDSVKTGDKTAGRHFALRPKTAAQHEEDLQRKVNTADQDYQQKVQNAQAMRQELQTAHRPQAVQAIVQLIKECDSVLTLQLQKYGKNFATAKLS
jgi:Rho GTPase-activating protein RGD1